jgi:putative chitinase
MTPTLYRFLLPLGLALALSSCDVFRPDADPAANNPPYGAASPYATNNNPGGYPPNPQPQGANAYGAASGAPNTGAYGQPNYNTPTPGYTTPNYTPYTQPAENPSSTGGAPAGGRTHTVVSGENLSKIAQRYGTTTDAIMRANNITDPNYVRAGQQLTIP